MNAKKLKLRHSLAWVIGLTVLSCSSVLHAQNSPPALEVKGNVAKPFSLSLDEFRALPHKTIQVNNEHDKKQETYEGVPLADLLKRAGVPQGSDLRGAALATYIVAEAGDGYRVAFSLGELDSSIVDSQIIVADRLDGAPMSGELGPLRLVVPGDKRPARWVRMLRDIRVGNPPKSN